MRLFRRCRPEGSAIPMGCPVRANKAQNFPLPNWDRLIYPKVPEPAMALVGQKGSKAQLQVPDSATASHNPVRVTGGEMARESKRLVSQRSRSRRIPEDIIWMTRRR